MACVCSKQDQPLVRDLCTLGTLGTPQNSGVVTESQSRADKIPSSRVSNLGFEDCLADCSGATTPILPQIYQEERLDYQIIPSPFRSLRTESTRSSATICLS